MTVWQFSCTMLKIMNHPKCGLRLDQTDNQCCLPYMLIQAQKFKPKKNRYYAMKNNACMFALFSKGKTKQSDFATYTKRKTNSCIVNAKLPKWKAKKSLWRTQHAKKFTPKLLPAFRRLLHGAISARVFLQCSLFNTVSNAWAAKSNSCKQFISKSLLNKEILHK